MTRVVELIEIEVPAFVEGSPTQLQTFRFAKPTEDLPLSFEAIPSIASISFSPATVSLGGDLGGRASISVAFTDHRFIFDGEPVDQGTFWGKWRGRYGTKLRGYPLRWRTGTVDQAVEDMETLTFAIDSTDGPDGGGTYAITAKDLLKAADDDRAQAPLPNTGKLISDITTATTSVTLSPTFIGDDEYAASGYVCIGGNEVCSFTRSGDNLTLVRGQLGTTAVAHSASDRVQQVLRYSGEDPADIIYDLLVNYAGVPPEFIDLPAWQLETTTFLGRVYGADLTEPVGVRQLISDLISEAALAVWYEPDTTDIRLKVLRAIPTDARTFTEDDIIAGSVSITEQADTRISDIWTYFGRRDPTRPLDEEANYRSVEVDEDDTSSEYGSAAIKKVFARWIPSFGNTTAERLNDLLLSRYRDPPRRFQFSLSRAAVFDGLDTPPRLGDGYKIQLWQLQTAAGAQAVAPIQVTRVSPEATRYIVQAEEMLVTTVDPGDLGDRMILIDTDTFDVNLRDLHDSLYPDVSLYLGSPSVTLTVIIAPNVRVGATTPSTPAFDVGSWPGDIQINIQVKGRIEGAGGKGGASAGTINADEHELTDGFDGGTAFYTRRPVRLFLDDGDAEIWGGGGGGTGGRITDGGKKAGSGGGGAGYLAGNGGDVTIGTAAIQFGQPGTDTDGGAGGSPATSEASVGGFGGDPGQDGQDIGNGHGGDGGKAIDGLSFVTKTGAGDIKGSQVN